MRSSLAVRAVGYPRLRALSRAHGGHSHSHGHSHDDRAGGELRSQGHLPPLSGLESPSGPRGPLPIGLELARAVTNLGRALESHAQALVSPYADTFESVWYGGGLLWRRGAGGGWAATRADDELRALRTRQTMPVSRPAVLSLSFGDDRTALVKALGADGKERFLSMLRLDGVCPHARPNRNCPTLLARSNSPLALPAAPRAPASSSAPRPPSDYPFFHAHTAARLTEQTPNPPLASQPDRASLATACIGTRLSKPPFPFCKARLSKAPFFFSAGLDYRAHDGWTVVREVVTADGPPPVSDGITELQQAARRYLRIEHGGGTADAEDASRLFSDRASLLAVGSATPGETASPW